MTCEEVRRMVTDKPPEQATKAEQAAVAKHMCTCASCAVWADENFPAPSILDSEVLSMFGGVSSKDLLVGLLRQLPERLRVEVFREFCVHCGSSNPKCQCRNDE